MTDHILSWLFTYALHSTVLLGGAWLVTSRWIRAHDVREVVWKSALVGALVTASLQAVVGLEPIGGLVSIARGAPTAARQTAILAPTTTDEVGAIPVADVEQSNVSAPVAGPLFNADKAARIEAAAAAAVETPRASAPSLRSAFSAFSAFSALSIWAAVALVLLALYGANRLRLFYRLGSRRPVQDPGLTGMLERLRLEAGVRRPVSLTFAPGLSSPVALGRSEIALPEAALTELSPEAQESMLAHELAHLVRRDPQWLTFGCVLERILFFQPLNRLARLRVQEAAEFLCDDWAARRTGSGLVLAKCLVKVAEWIDTSAQPVPLSAMAERRSQLVSRIHRLIENHAMRPQPRRFWLVPAAVTLVLVSAFAVPGISALPSAAQQPTGTPDSTQPDTGVRSMESSLRRLQTNSRMIEHRAMRQMRAALAHVPTPPIAPLAPMEPMVRLDVDRAMHGVEVGVKVGRNKGDTNNTAVPALIAALKDSDVEVRRAAASSLGNLEDPRAVPALVEALRDTDAEVRADAADALSNMEDPRAIPGLTAALKDSSPAVRRRAICALSNFENNKPVDAFIAALSDSDAEVREAAIDAVSETGDKRAVRPLIKLLSDPSADVRHQAAHALGELQDPSAAEPLSAALRDSDADVRGAAAQSLSEVGLTQAPAGLLEAAKDKNADVRQYVAQALGEIRDPKSVTTLRTMLGDANADVREAAINALSEVRDSSALEALVAALKSTDPNVRRQAAEALGQRDEN